ncbi:MAG: hypothetical protein CMN32_07125 [Saprospirales bacterium]|nr:hypothetical protein [Saprospirales bacterium]
MEQTLLPKSIRIWLFAGVVMVFFQVVIGGVTRLTDSGLSITEWAVIQGTIPPLNEAEWQEAFDKYKVAAKKQYETLHADMDLSEFKVIFFWEYLHRLWARLMGFVFLFPFLYFYFKKMLPKWLLKRLGIVIALAALAAIFGWIMVKSGLNNDKRTWVSAYKLVIHLGIATALFGYLFWTWMLAAVPVEKLKASASLRKMGYWLLGILLVQILFGGLMAGMRAGLIHPHFPIFVEGSRLWNALVANFSPDVEQLIDYEPNLFAKAVVQVLHRLTAWVLFFYGLYFSFKALKTDLSKRLNRGIVLFTALLITQLLLGIFTVINSIGRIPVSWGALHQGMALLLLSALLYCIFLFGKQQPGNSRAPSA